MFEGVYLMGNGTCTCISIREDNVFLLTQDSHDSVWDIFWIYCCCIHVFHQEN